jgi:hypothetical protein
LSVDAHNPEDGARLADLRTRNVTFGIAAL